MILRKNVPTRKKAGTETAANTTDDDVGVVSGNVRDDELALLGSSWQPALYQSVQAAITELTGKAYHDQQPVWQWSPLLHLATALVSLFGGAAASWAIANAYPLLLPGLFITFLFTVGGARKLQTMLLHQCVHNNFSGNKTCDRTLAEIISTILMVQGFEDYHRDHVKRHHHIEKFATLDDPDFQLLLQMGFRPGLPKAIYWQLLRQAILSPRFHWLFLRARFAANFQTAPLHHRVMAVAWNLVVLSVVTVTHSWLAFIVAWLFPLTALYHISALLQTCSEHRWLFAGDRK